MHTKDYRGDLQMHYGRKQPGGTVPYRPAASLGEADRLPLWWFHPGRPGTSSRRPDPVFLRKLEESFPGIAVNWHPFKQRWQVWARNARITTPYCKGWQLLFTLRGPQDEYVPLDERALLAIWDRSGRKWGNGAQYFDRIEAEIARDRRARDRHNNDERTAKVDEYWEYTKIKNIGSGAKFVRHHAGD